MSKSWCRSGDSIPRARLREGGIHIGHRGEVLVNERLETSVSNVCVIGDVMGTAMLAHVASAQGCRRRAIHMSRKRG
ncbi:MAG: FAD-dependent oxidoreductase [Nitrospiraceae bacterium]